MARNKLTAEIKDTETNITMQRINEILSPVKFNKIDKPLTKLTKRHKEKIQVNKN